MTLSRDSKSGNRIKIDLIVAIAVGVIGIYFCVVNPKALDNCILLENVRPGYWNNLAFARTEYGEVSRNIEKTEERQNYIINSLGTVEGDGFTLTTNEDGTIHFSGKNEGVQASYVFCTLEDLPEGNYVYDDGVDDAGIFTYALGKKYLIGGTENTSHLDREFSADYEKYEFRVEIVSGFSGDVLIKPMLRKNQNLSEEYEPCLTQNVEITDGIGYALIWITPLDYLKLQDDDKRYLYNRIQGKDSGIENITICFGDYTGVKYSFSDLSNPTYGKVDSVGCIIEELSYNDLNEELTKKNEQELHSVESFPTYLEKLKEKNYTVLFSINDDGVIGLNSYCRKKIDQLGLKTDFFGKYRYGYLAVIDEGNVVFEEINKDCIQHDGVLSNGASYNMTSAGALSGSNSSIIINGREYSMNKRGINIVVMDKDVVIDTVNFDTWSMYCTSYRSEEQI